MSLNYSDDSYWPATGSISCTNGTASGNIIFATDTITADIDFGYEDPLIKWLPYKVKKYFPVWHLLRSYRQ